jgi:hypothetical protein
VTLHTTRFVSRTLLFVSLWLACAGRNAVGDEPAKPVFKVGDSVRFNSVNLIKVPGTVRVAASLEDYRSEVAKLVSRDAKAKSKYFYSHENQVFIGHNTLATISDLQSIESPDQTRVIACVILKSGPFKGQKFWVNTLNFRPASQPDPADSFEVFDAKTKDLMNVDNFKVATPKQSKGVVSKRIVKKSRAVPPKRDGKLALTDLTASEEGGSIYITGRFLNTSGEDLKGTWAQVHFEDSKGKLIRMNSGICLPGVVAPGETGTFRVLQDDDCRDASIKITFSDLQSSISWTDESGKNAHP